MSKVWWKGRYESAHTLRLNEISGQSHASMSKLEKGMAWHACKLHGERKEDSKEGREGGRTERGEREKEKNIHNQEKKIPKCFKLFRTLTKMLKKIFLKE